MERRFDASSVNSDILCYKDNIDFALYEKGYRRIVLPHFHEDEMRPSIYDGTLKNLGVVILMYQYKYSPPCPNAGEDALYIIFINAVFLGIEPKKVSKLEQLIKESIVKAKSKSK